MGVVSWSDEQAREEEACAFGLLPCSWPRSFVEAPIVTGAYRLLAVERAT